MNALFDKLEAGFKQSLRDLVSGSATPTVDAQAKASVLTAFCMGRLQRYARSGFKRSPTEHLEASLSYLLA